MKNPVSIARDIYSRLPEESIRYIIAGVLTTLIDFGLFTLLTALGVDDKLSNGISIATAVIFAYIINKLYVFRRHTGSLRALIAEFLMFLGGRVFTSLLEYWGYPLLLGLLGDRKSVAKAITIVVVFVLNYVISKLFVFRRQKAGSSRRDL